MSAFIAIVNRDGTSVDPALLERLTDLLHFRGPDRRSVWHGEAVGLGHALFRTNAEDQYDEQPASLDGEVWITGNIRIDGRRDLLDKLKLTREIKLHQTPDSELILHAYRAWGERCIEHLIGDFAFVIWDSRRQQIFCARDRFGMRQLYYAQVGSTFVVGNMLHSLLQMPGLGRRLNDRAMAGFLLFGDHTWLDKRITPFADIQTLPPAHVLIRRSGHLTVKRYWDVPFDIPLLRYRREADYIAHFEEVFSLAVADRVRDPKLVISMSGGLDSTAIVATVHTLGKKGAFSRLDVKAVTAVYDRIVPDEERYYAGLVAEKLDLPIEYVVGDEYALLRPSRAMTRPLELATPAFWLDIRKTMAKCARVVLTGAAADNLLECSPARSMMSEVNPVRLLVELLHMRARYGRFPTLGSGLISALQPKRKVNRNRLISPYPYPSWLNPDFERKLGLKECWIEWQNWQPNPLNRRHPRAHNSLIGPDWNNDDLCLDPEFTLPEERDPYLDLRLVEFVFSLPPLPWLFRKHLLRRAMRSKLPKKVVDRPKTPLGTLEDALLKQRRNSWVDQWTAAPALGAYVQRERIPPLLAAGSDPADRYVNLRPLLLNSWIEQAVE